MVFVRRSLSYRSKKSRMNFLFQSFLVSASMDRIKYALTVCFFVNFLTLFVCSTCVAINVSSKIFPDVVDLKIPRYIQVYGAKDILLTYADSKNNISIVNATTNKKWIVNTKHSGFDSGLVSIISGDNVFLVWRRKTNEKSLWFSQFNLIKQTIGEPILVDKTTRPLTRIDMAKLGGKLFLLWYGELPHRGRNYSMYASYYPNDSKTNTFSKPVRLTKDYKWAIYPRLLKGDKGVYAFTEAIRYDNKTHELVVAKFENNEWQPLRVIGKIGVMSLFLRAIKVQNRICVFWFNFYDGEPVTEMAYSDDGGVTWKRHVFEDTRGLDLTGLHVASNGKNRLYVVLSGVRLDKEGAEEAQEGKKDLVYFMYSGDGGSTWSSLRPLRHYPFTHTRAHIPNIVAHDDTVVVVWNDYRNIRGNLYMNYSTDGGKTWQDHDIPLEEPGKYNTRLHWDVNNLKYKNGKYYLLAHRFESDLLEKAHPLFIEFRLP
ncbi:MAG: exo-alpha-sialidase [Deltaproteobacteria bacterium]|nr:exo-alpha-sialidase [Deltaproteobacteria bacterium]